MTFQSTRYTSFWISLLLISLMGCQTAYYSAMEKVGIHKRDILIDRVEEATTSQEEAKEEFKSALEQLSSLISFQGGELQAQYEASSAQYEASVEAAKKVSEHIEKVDDVATALFTEWEDEITQYSNKSLQRQSQSTLRQTQLLFNSLMRSMRRSEQQMAPILATLRDHTLFLKHNLNASAIGALKGEYQTIKKGVEQLITEMNKSIAESQAFIATLKTNS
mgnify:CR=1 FL=1